MAEPELEEFEEPSDMTEIIAKWRQDPANDESGWFCASDEEQ